MNKPVLGKNLQMENSIVYPMYANPKTVKRCNTAKPHANSLMPIDENTEIYSGDCKRSRNWFEVQISNTKCFLFWVKVNHEKEL